MRPRIHERPRPYRPEECPRCSWTVIGEDVHRPGTRPCRPGTPHAQGSASRLTVNKSHQAMHSTGSGAMNSHDIKKCEPAKAAHLPQPASSHAVSGTPGHERVGSTTAAGNQEKEPPGHRNGHQQKWAPQGAHKVNSLYTFSGPQAPEQGKHVPEVGLELHSGPCNHWEVRKTKAIRASPTNVRPSPKRKSVDIVHTFFLLRFQLPRGHHRGFPLVTKRPLSALMTRGWRKCLRDLPFD